MKVHVNRREQIFATKTETTREARTSLLPAVDSWYAFHRTIPAVYLFPGYGQDPAIVIDELRASLTRSISKIPRLTAALELCSIPHPIREAVPRKLQRLQAIDGEAGAEFIGARTNAQIKSLLLPKAVDKSKSFLWERSDKSLAGLFATESDGTGLRVQVTSFGCGGFSIVIDADHALADGYTIGLFMHTWSFEHCCEPSTLPIPINHFDPPLDAAVDESIARGLPTLGPHFRGTLLPSTSSLGPGKNSAIVPNLMRLSSEEFTRMTRAVQQEAGDPSMTQYTAWFGIMWAAINRTRKLHGLDPVRQARVARSMRPELSLSAGAIGSPFLIVIIEADESMADRSIDSELATLIASTTARYDRQAMLSVAYDATLRDSPASAKRLADPPSCLIFTPGFQATSGRSMRFGPVEPSFLMPLYLQREGIMMIGKVADGMEMFFSLPAGHAQTLVRDVALSGVELISDFE